MNILKKIGPITAFMLLLCIIIIFAAEYLFLNGNELHGIFLGLWAPTLLGFLIFFKLLQDGR